MAASIFVACCRQSALQRQYKMAASVRKNVMSVVHRWLYPRIGVCGRCSSGSTSGALPYSDRDPAPYFFNQDVQALLKKVTGLDLEKVYAPKKMEPTDPVYKFTTEEELQKMLEKAKAIAKDKMQMPPVVQERKPISEVLSYDPELKEFENCKLIFTDITYGVSNRNRLIVARDTDGTLRKASWEERDRMNQIFFPIKHRKITIPKMFEDDYFQSVLNDRHYNYILDRACIQFEPDDPNYIRVTTKTYDHIDSTRSYTVLYSTRHFGPMAFYFCFYEKIDNLLLDFINKERLDNAVDLIQVYYQLNPDLKAPVEDSSKTAEYIRSYSQTSPNRTSIELALRSYEELQRQIKETNDAVKKAHGYVN